MIFLDTEEKNRVSINKKKINELKEILSLIDIESLKKNLDNVYKLIVICERVRDNFKKLFK